MHHRNKHLHLNYFDPNQLNRGYISFLTVLVISAVVFSVVSSTAILGVTHVQNSFNYRRSEEVFRYGQGCLEEAFLKLKQDASYMGETLQVGNTSCTINISGSGNQRSIDVFSESIGIPTYQRHILALSGLYDQSITILLNEVQ